MTVNQQFLESIIKEIKPLESNWLEQARDRTAQLVMPFRALGRLHDLAERLCAIQRTLRPSVARKGILVMAADHGVTDEQISAYPPSVTVEMIKTFLSGGAGINVLANWLNADIQIVDMGTRSSGAVDFQDPGGRLRVHKIDEGTANFVNGPAMQPAQAVEAVLTGYRFASEWFDEGIEVMGTGDMGIGNTTPSAAIGAVITGSPLETMVGPGTGVDNQGLARKKAVIQRAIDYNRPDSEDGLDVLSKMGGFEIGAIAGIILAAAHKSRAVVIDGFISTAGALIAHAMCPVVLDYVFAGHCSEEPGHRAMLEYLGLSPILDLGMRLGEGTGGALSMGVIEAAARIICEMATFDEAGVSSSDT